MDFVSPIITPIVESLLVPVKRHLGFLISSSNYVRDMHARMTELNGIAHDMEMKKEGNDANSLVVPHHVPVWLVEVEAIKAKAESIPPGGVGCLNMKMRYNTGKRSSGILKDIDRLMKEKSEIEWTNEQIPLGKVSSKRPSTSALVHEHDDNTQSRLKSSRDLIFNDVLKSLESNDNKTRMMALCGMGGVGKTTMMEQVKKVVADKKMFDWIVKVVIGKNRNPIDIQNTIAEYIGHPLAETDKNARADRLQKRFEMMSEEGKKKILVILDDVWEEINLKDIGISSFFPNGFKLLLTSRDENICTQMGVEASLIFRIVVLEDLEAKKLFWETTGLNSNSERHLYQIGEDIVKRCGGLPLAITTIACALRDKMEKDEWEDALTRLQKKKFDDYNIKAIFEISYKNLKEDDLKEIFLLSGLFPEDCNIGKEDLLRYGWGMKFFQNVHTIAEARRRVNTCVNKLIRSNLLINSDREGCVKMHDLVRDFVLSNFSTVKQASIVNHSNNVSEDLREERHYDRILLKCGGMFEFPVDFNNEQLALLKLMDADKLLKFPEDFYTRMVNLQVVAYQNIRELLLLRYSTNLRALCLSSCSLVNDDISFLGDLVNLEVLSLANCGIGELPSRIGKLKRLKLLDLTACRELCIHDGVFQNLDKLEELYMGVSKGSTIRFTDANCTELKMLSRKLSALELEFFENKAQPVDVFFENLERFRISMGCLLEKKTSDEYSFKNTLKLVSSSSEVLECKIYELFRKTEILHLEVKDMSYLEDILVHPSENPFCNLKELCISNCESMTYLFTIFVANGLTKLESLEIRSCPAMKSVVNGENSEAGVITFHKLKFLFLNNLPELVSLCDSAHAVALPQLMELKLHGLPNITSIFPGTSINISDKYPLLAKEIVIPKLISLTILGMMNLKEIWPCEIATSKEEVNNIPMLRKFEVEDCNSIVDLFPNNPMRLLCHLEELTVRKCGSIEVLFNIELGKSEQLSSSYSSLRNITVWGCESFREVWRIQDAENNYSSLLIRGFPSVEHIVILDCEKLKNIVTPTTAKLDMTTIKGIHIGFYGIYGERKNELVKNSQEQEINIMSKEGISKVGDNISVVAFPSHQITHNFCHLRYITLTNSQGVEAVFEIESPSNKDQLVTTQPPLPLLPYLENLCLMEMDMLTHV